MKWRHETLVCKKVFRSAARTFSEQPLFLMNFPLASTALFGTNHAKGGLEAERTNIIFSQQSKNGRNGSKDYNGGREWCGQNKSHGSLRWYVIILCVWHYCLLVGACLRVCVCASASESSACVRTIFVNDSFVCKLLRSYYERAVARRRDIPVGLRVRLAFIVGVSCFCLLLFVVGFCHVYSSGVVYCHVGVRAACVCLFVFVMHACLQTVGSSSVTKQLLVRM